MALVLNDRVKETSTTEGTGTLNLAGAVSGFEGFVAGIGSTNSTYYSIAHQTADEWEVGTGTVTDATPDTLTRSVISSSNSDSLVVFSAGTKEVFCTEPASKTMDMTLTTAGDTMYASAANTPARLAIGTGRYTLQTNSGATAPEWAASPQSVMTAAGDILYASGANTLAKLAKGSDTEVLTLASGVPSWAASTTGFSWDTSSIKTGDFTATAGNGYFCNTTSGILTITLPTSPTAGDQVGLIDYAGTFDTNALTIGRAGEKIEGVATDQATKIERTAMVLTYVDSTQGWLITSEGSSTPIITPTISFDTAAGTLGTITDANRGSYSLSSAAGSVSIGTLTYAIASGSLPAGLSLASSNAAITGTATAVATNTTSTFTVRATGNIGNPILDREFTITVNAAILTWTTAAGTLGTILDSQRASGYSLSAATATATSGTVSYAIQSGSIPTGLSLNTSTAAITGTATAVSSDTVSNFTVRATTTSASVYADRAFSIQVDDPIISWTTAAGTLGTITDANRASYSLSAATATVTSGTLSYAINSGSLPAGLSLNTSTAAITGTATAVSSDTVSTFEVRATTTSASEYDDRTFTIQVDDPILTFTTAAGTLGTIEDVDRASPPTYGGSLAAATATATSGTVSYAISSGSIPAGMSFNTSTAAFSGTADAVGSATTSSFDVTATTTSASESLARSFTITINEPATITYVVVAGGGGGGDQVGGGGGAGGMLTGSWTAVGGTVYTCTVGTGGGGGSGGGAGSQGNTSSIAGSGISTISCTGGGYGGSYAGTQPGGSGGSGGGGGRNSQSGGSGTAGQGYAGGNSSSVTWYGGGGGGNTQVGEVGGLSGGVSGKGGDGGSTSITGSSITLAGGGGGCRDAGGASSGGSGGGGAGGGNVPSTGAGNGTAYTGGGGGGNRDAGGGGGDGGTGTVILSVPTSGYSGTTTGSPTITTSGSDTIIRFNGGGSYTG